MQKKSYKKYISGEKQAGNRLRAVFALALLLCFVLLALIYAFLSDTPLIYGLISVQLPSLLAQKPTYEQHFEFEEAPDTTKNSNRITIDIADVEPDVGEDIRIELEKPQQAPKDIELSGSDPKILIYHTHTTEAYTQTKNSRYKESGQWRTSENDKNIVAVGEKLAQLLKNKYGFNVIHDITNHEPPKLATSYSRSVVTMAKYKKKYPSITMFIDVHRDAGKTHNEGADYVMIDGKPTARLMFVVGTGEGATGTGFDVMPDFSANYALAKMITEHIDLVNQKLMRNIRVKTGRYNQHLTNKSLLVEVGHNINTLEEALNAIDYLADAIAACAIKPLPSTAKAPTITSGPGSLNLTP